MIRRKWGYTAQPAATQSPYQQLSHPRTGAAIFGRFPEIILNNMHFPEGAIYLKYGAHFGPNNGFGFRHIWVEHFTDMTDHDQAQTRIREFVATILVPHTPIFYEIGSKAAVFKGSTGQVIVELRDQATQTPSYSIVTAYVPKNAKGSRIGALA